MTLRQRILRRLVNLYPPFLGAGIKVRFDDKSKRIDVSMGLKWYNRNYVGTHFGGSLYTMCDPFYMLLLMDLLGTDYIVWDKAAKIEFIKPGRSTVYATFHVPDAVLGEIKKDVEKDGKAIPEFVAQVKDESGDLVARVHKYIYVRKKEKETRET